MSEAAGEPRPDRRLPSGLRGIVLRLVPVLLAALGTVSVQANPGPVHACSTAGDSYHTLWVAGDFDGDEFVDLARVRVRRDRDGILTSGVGLVAFCPHSVPPLLSGFIQTGLVLGSLDVDADDDHDLVLREPIAGHVLGVWLNDGTGEFSEADPSDFPAAGRDAASLEGPTSRVRAAAVSLSSQTQFLVAPGIGFTPCAGAPQHRRKNSTQVAPASRDTARSRAPPFPSF